ncbi:type II secretion system protein [Peribacillus alkalitolerans]|uniref:type II secretion system protein n=1 Tax=Peribacillus alkalitolerans TaxID=1550385 RepID=UPI0013D42C79|nr:type II secretion system protein [Peribacillus alkalitolerans]
METKINENGFTLIELLVSFTILGIIFVFFFSYFTNAFQYNNRTSNTMKVVNVVREQQALIKQEPYKSEIQKFLTNVNPQIDASDLLKSNYPSLNLKNNIEVVNRKELQGTNQIDVPYYKFTFKDSSYSIVMYIKQQADLIPQAVSSILYKVYIFVNQNNKLSSDTYTFFEFKK